MYQFYGVATNTAYYRISWAGVASLRNMENRPSDLAFNGALGTFRQLTVRSQKQCGLPSNDDQIKAWHILKILAVAGKEPIPVLNRLACQPKILHAVPVATPH